MCLANVFSRFVFRFAKVCVGEMIDSYIFVELCAANHMCLRILNVGRMYMYIVFHVTCGRANVYFHLASMCSPRHVFRLAAEGWAPGPRLDQVIDDGRSHAIFSAGVVFSTHRSVWRKLVAI